MRCCATCLEPVTPVSIGADETIDFCETCQRAEGPTVYVEPGALFAA